MGENLPVGSLFRKKLKNIKWWREIFTDLQSFPSSKKLFQNQRVFTTTTNFYSKSHKEGKKSDVISLLSFHLAFDLEIDARRKMEMYFSGIYGPSMHPISSATVWISLIVDIHVYKYIFLRVVSLFHEADSSVSLFQSSNMDFLLHLLLTPAHDYTATFLYSVSCNILHLDPHPS